MQTSLVVRRTPHLAMSLALLLALAACGGGGGGAADTRDGGPGSALENGPDGTGGSSGTSGTSGAGPAGTTFCVVVETSVRTCSSPVSQSTTSESTCTEDVADCKALVPGPASEKSGSCDIDKRYKVSEKNQGGPHAGTCTQYHRWNDGHADCLDDSDCGAGRTCREQACFCGATRWNKREASSPKSTCDGNRVVLPMDECVDGVTKPKLNVTDDCAAQGKTCVSKDGYAICESTSVPPG